MSYPYLKIFLAGTHSTAHSKKVWNDADIDKVLASTLANSEDKIPFTAQGDDGKHPSGNLPVFGWADKSTLRKTTHKGVTALEIQPCEFADGLLGKLKDTPINKMSVRFDGADFSLEHICFVERPAAKDVPPLSDYDFSEGKEGDWIDLSADVDMADSRMPMVGSKLRSLRDWFIGKFGLEEANKAIPEYGIDEMNQWKSELPEWAREQIDDIFLRVRALEGKTDTGKQSTIITDYNFSEDEMKELEELRAAQAKTNADFAAFQETATKREADLKTSNDLLQKQIAAMQDAAISRDNADFVDALVREGKMLPAERDVTVQDLNLAAKNESKINFSGAEKTILEAKREMLLQRPVIAPLGKPIATKAATGKNADFSMDTREEEIKLRKAAEKLAKEQGVDFAEALNILLDENEPEGE